MAESIPDAMREVDTRYWVISAEKFAEAARIMGGAITVTD